VSIDSLVLWFFLVVGAAIYMLANWRVLALVKLQAFLKDGSISSNSNSFPFCKKSDIQINGDLDSEILDRIKREIAIAFLPIPFAKYFYTRLQKSLDESE